MNKESEVPAATLMVQFIRLTERIASQDKPTAITIGCRDSTVRELETIKNMLGGFLNIIKRLNINQILSEFLSAMRASAISA